VNEFEFIFSCSYLLKSSREPGLVTLVVCFRRTKITNMPNMTSKVCFPLGELIRARYCTIIYNSIYSARSLKNLLSLKKNKLDPFPCSIGKWLIHLVSETHSLRARATSSSLKNTLVHIIPKLHSKPCYCQNSLHITAYMSS
jgi:hypothetical protein